MSTDLLPEIVPAGREIRVNDPEEVVKADDLRQIHVAMTKVRQLWVMPLSVDEVCKLALTTTKLIECRHKVTGYGSGHLKKGNRYNDGEAICVYD